MSHYRERKERDCLNCNAVVYGRYCHLCGQENVAPKETFPHLVTHFIFDITHFDGKFFSTVKYLLLKPGFLPKEYIRGRRMSYLNPIKMYVFVSAFFFLFFFSVINPSFNQKQAKEGEVLTTAELTEDIKKEIEDMEAEIKKKDIAATAKKILESEAQLLRQDLVTLQNDTSHLKELNYYRLQEAGISRLEQGDTRYYDSGQKALPVNKQNSWLIKFAMRKIFEVRSKYKNSGEFFEKLFEKFRHSFPQLLFVSLPIFALLLKLLYLMKKQFYYADHIVYSVHLYSAMFILMFFITGFSHFSDIPYLHWLSYFTTIAVIYTIWYQYQSLRNFYEQSKRKTVLKYVLLLTMSSVVMSLLFLIFIVFSVFNM